ncbi:MAG: tetratricopeptide repeat protein [Candidatus Eisenbacteria sp.]|nr:tetratricopeptide repeat protein [Candidatus Eisenbacteria bacterium]
MVPGKARGNRERLAIAVHRLRPWAPMLIALLAFALRLIHLLNARQSPLFDSLGLDAKFYDRWATAIAEGDWLSQGPFFMGPLYPYFLAVFYRLFDTSIFQTAIIQAVIDSASCALIYVTGCRLWGREKEGLLAGLLACFYGPMILYTGELLFPTLAMFINILFLYLVVRADESWNPGVLFLAGILLGLSALGKATVLVFYPVVVAWWLVKRPRPALRSLVRPAAVLALGVAAMVLPVTARNRMVGGDWVLITSNAGLNFHIGNNAQSSGAYLRPASLDVSVDPAGQRIAEAAWGRSLKPSEVSKYWFSESLKFLDGHPERFASLFLKKMVFFWSAWEVPQIESFNFQKRYSPILKLPFPSYGWIVPLAVVGVVLAGSRRRWAALPMGLAVAYSLAIAVFFVTGRYRMAVLPYLLILSAGGILVLAEGLRDWRRIALGGGIFLALAALAHSNPYHVDPESGFAEFEYRLGLGYEKTGDLERAEIHYGKALEYEPFHPGTRLNLGVIYSRTGREKEGEGLLESLTRRYPDHAKAHFNLGLVYADQGSFDAATREFLCAVTIDPAYVRAWDSYGAELYRSGELGGAGKALETAISLSKSGVEGAWIQASRFILAKLERQAEIRAGEGPSARLLRDADLLAAAGKWDDAFGTYLRAGRGGVAAGYYEAGMAAYNLNRWADALDALRECTGLDPRFPGAHHLIGAVYVKMEDYDAAVEAMEAEREISPEMADVYFKLGLLYENHTKDLDAAAEAYEKYLSLNGPRPDIVRGRLAKIRNRR